MRILHVASGDLMAGAEVMLWNLCRAQIEHQGLDVYVVVLNEGTLAERLRNQGCTVHVLDEKRLNPLAVFGQLWALLREIRPHMVHTHREKENVLGAIAARLTRIPSIRTVHGASEHPAGWWAFRKQLAGFVDRIVATKIQSSVVAVSEDLADRLRGSLRTNCVQIIWNGVDPHETRQRALSENNYPAAPGRKRITYLGRLAPVKQVDRLLLAFATLERRQGNRELYVVGSGPERERLEALASELGLGQGVVFTGYVEEAMPLLRESSCLVLTSEHEGMPISVLEALALGVPVVAPPVGGLPELIDESQGILCSCDDPDTFAGAIRQACRRDGVLDPRLPPKFESRFMADAYLRLYRSRLDNESWRVAS